MPALFCNNDEPKDSIGVADNTNVVKPKPIGSRFKGYKRWTLFKILIKARNTRHTPLGEMAL